MTRLCLCALTSILCCSSLLAADLKVKTRSTFQGHASEGTVYIKGARMRDESSFGPVLLTITQCDQRRIITVFASHQCTVISWDRSGSCPAMSGELDNRSQMADGKSTVARKCFLGRIGPPTGRCANQETNWVNLILAAIHSICIGQRRG